MVYAKHFVKSLPSGHGPVFLFMDGHASHWNRFALKYLMDNRVFTFFLASHTSIWSQPNDAGVNKRFHWAVEQICKTERRNHKNCNIRYFNSNFLNGWYKFLETERDDLRQLGVNNATRAFKRTGLFPYNPFSVSWTNAIETIGQGEKPSAGT